MGRLHRRGIESWRKIIDAQRSSGLAVAAYCRKQGINPCSFYYWRRRLSSTLRFDSTELAEVRPEGRSPTRSEAAATAGFVELRNPVCAVDEGIEIDLAGGRRLRVRRGYDRDLLIEVIRVLEGIA
jgi:transposase-like protein